MSWASLRDPRTLLIAAALALAVLALVVPRVLLNRDAYDVVAVIDITTSMNTRDATSKGETTSRLAAAKASLRELLAKLPCGSRLGRHLRGIDPRPPGLDRSPAGGRDGDLDLERKERRRRSRPCRFVHGRRRCHQRDRLVSLQPRRDGQGAVGRPGP